MTTLIFFLTELDWLISLENKIDLFAEGGDKGLEDGMKGTILTGCNGSECPEGMKCNILANGLDGKSL